MRTNQLDRVLIALTRDGIPRTAETISTETGIPRASVRRVLSELRTTADPRVLRIVGLEANR